MPERIIRSLSLVVNDEEYRQGDVADVPEEDVERYEASGALVPEGFDSYEAFEAASLDAYRGGRGDVEANARAMSRAAEARQGGIVDVSTEAPGNPFVEVLRDDALNTDETIALAEGDPAKAAQVLEAENVVTGQDPRKGVVEALDKIINAEQ